MAKDNNQTLPSAVLEIKRQTEEMIRVADQIFLGQCGILWEEDIEHPSVP